MSMTSLRLRNFQEDSLTLRITRMS